MSRAENEVTAIRHFAAAKAAVHVLLRQGLDDHAKAVHSLARSHSNQNGQIKYLQAENARLLMELAALEAEARQLLEQRYGTDNPGWKAEQEFRRQSGGGEG
jgi:chromosome segregation ATPase